MMRFPMTAIAGAFLLAGGAMAEPLASWNEGKARDAIIAFVETVTDPESGGFIPEEERIATFDNDGCLWAEQPVYFQLLYALDRLRERAADAPSILSSDVLRAAAKGDLKAALAGGEPALEEILSVSHSGMSVETFQREVHDWLVTARHPETGRHYIDMTYQPMVELLEYLRENGFQTYIVSGGGQDFIRAFAGEAYGIPPEQVVGSEGKLRFQQGTGDVMKTGGVFFVDDKAGKPLGIMRHIGRRPVFAAGNSDGDFQMLEYTMAGEGMRFAMLIHHTDGKREFAYDRESASGRLDRGLNEAGHRGWLLVDMAEDWRQIWPSKDSE